MNDLEAETQVLTGVFGDTLSDPLWDFDYEMVQQRLERLLATGAIAGARVVDADGKPVAAALAAGLDPAPASDHLIFDSEIAAQTGEAVRSEEHTYELLSLMRVSYTVLSLKNKTTTVVKERE